MLQHHHFRRDLFVLLALLAVILPDAASARSIGEPQSVPHLNARGRNAYREYLQAEMHRAFVIAPGGAWAWKAGLDTPEEARNAALEECTASTEQTCVVYAVNDDLVFNEKQWVSLWGPYLSAAEAGRAPEGTRRGERFPDLLLTDPAGQPLKLSSLRGKVTFLHFWGTWCPSCVHELPQFEKLQAALRGTPELVFLFSQVREPYADARNWLKEQGLNLPLYDSGSHGAQQDRLQLGDGRNISDRALAPVFPTTYVLDRQGIVVFSMRGSASDWSQYAAFLRDLAARSPK